MEYVFLVCSERSGSNLITKIMDAHSEVSGPSPTHLFRMLLTNYEKYGDLQNDANWENFIADALELFNAKLSVWQTSWALTSLREAAKERSVASLLKTIFEKEAELAGKKKLFIKENHVENFYEILEKDFGKPKYVVLVRDPRDMALSWKRSPILRGSVIRAARRWAKDQKFARKLLTELAPERTVLLKYEKILTDSEPEITRLCDFLEIEFEETMLDFRNRTLTKKNAEQTDDWKNLNKPIMKNNFNKFQNGLSETEIQFVEAVCGDEMEFFGYEKIYAELPSVDTLEEKLKPFELYEKPEYALIPETEKKQRAGQRAAMKKIEGEK